MSAASFQFIGGEALQRALAQAPALVDQHLGAAIDELLLLLQREIAERTPTGANQLLRKSIFASEAVELAKPVPGGIIGSVGTSLSYAVPVEFGTAPHFPWDAEIGDLPAALIDWVKAKFGLSGEPARQAAYAVAYKIKHHGTQGAFMFRDAFNAEESYMKRRLNEALQAVLAEMGA